MRGMKRSLMRALEALGVANGARRLRRRLTQPLHLIQLEAAATRARFWSPTARDEESIEYFTEREQLDAFVRMLRPGDTVWDVGAGTGTYSILAALRVGPDGIVYAFEPARRARGLLWVNRLLNGVRGSLQLERVGLGAKASRAVLVGERGAAARCVAAEGGNEAAPGQPPVQLVRADELLGGTAVRPPDCIKIDVEGAEADVLKGLGRYLSEGRLRLILCEVHPTLIDSFGSSVLAVRGLLEAGGYSISQVWSRGTEEHWLATRTPAARV